MGEAHRHEPPVPRDEVQVDTGREREESDENKLGAAKGAAASLQEPAQPQPQEEELGPKEGKEAMAENRPRGGTEEPAKNPKHVPEVKVQQGGRPPYKEQQPAQPAPDGEQKAEAGEKTKLQPPRKAEEAAEKEAEPGKLPLQRLTPADSSRPVSCPWLLLPTSQLFLSAARDQPGSTHGPCGSCWGKGGIWWL